MRRYDIALVNVLHLPVEFTQKLHEPVGLHILAAFLEANGFSATVMTGTAPECARFLDDIIVSCIGISCNYDNIFAVKRLAKHVRQRLNVPVIFGGPQAVAIDESFMRETDALAAVVGEGELPLLELMQLVIDKAGNIADIAGVLYLNEHRILKKNSPRKPIQNLDALPFPSRSHCFHRKFRTQNTVTIFTGRGCPFSCAFCYEGALLEKRVRNRSVSNVMSEIDAILLDNSRLRYICFVDDSFTLDARRVEEFCYSLAEKRKQYDFVWFCESRVDFILKHPNLIERMVSAGLVALQIGIESGDPMVLQAYKKRITPDQIEQAVAICYDKKIPSVYANYIIGGAFESNQTIENSMNHAKRLMSIAPGMIDLHTLFFAPYPETPMTKYPEQFGMRILEAERMECISSMESCVVETIDLTRTEITQLRAWFDSTVLAEMERSLLTCSLSQLLKITENSLSYRVYSRWFEILQRSECLYKFILLLQKEEAKLSSTLKEDGLPDLVPYRCCDSPILKDQCMTIGNESFDALATKLYLAASGKRTVGEITKNLQNEFPALQVGMAIEQFRLFENKRMLCFLV